MPPDPLVSARNLYEKPGRKNQDNNRYKKGNDMANRSRKEKILLYLSDDEKFILDEKWKLSDLPSRSDFLRQLIIYGFVYDVNYDGLKEYSKALNAIGKNINQIVRLCHKTGNVYEDDIKEIKELMEKTWHTQECMLSKQPLENQ